MPTKTKIEWADYVSNPLKATPLASPHFLGGENERKVKRGYACVKHSEGCANCWASAMNVRLGTGLAYTLPNLAKVALFWDEAEAGRLMAFKPKGPFKNGRAKPILFMHDMTDLFGGWVDMEHQKRTWGIMEERQDITFVILSKRPEQMLSFVAGSVVLPNVILGTSVENQKRADERQLPMMELARRGWQTLVSYEPALGPVEWRKGWQFLDWLICGGESGPSARPMHPNWARQARDFSHTYEIAFFFKQQGEWADVRELTARGMELFKNKPVDLDGTMMARVGKGQAGHLLDGQEWRQTL